MTETLRSRIFFTSCLALIATAMCFGVRADIIDSLRAQFSLSNEQMGWIAGTAFWGFTLSMLVGGQIVDAVGMKRLLAVAFAGHLAGIAATVLAGGFGALYTGTLLIGLANGLVEAAVNPLIPTLYPDHKTERLNRAHVWFPGGIVIGGVVSWLLTRGGFNWRIKMLSIVPIVLAYGFLFFRLDLPATERAQNRVPAGQMYREALRPGFLVLLGCIMLTAAAELGPNQWVPSLLGKAAELSGILVLAWITGLMAIGRSFAGPIVKRISPTALLMGSTVLAAAGLFGLSYAASGRGVMLFASVYAVGVCYCWPTMYGITAERFPKGGAFLLALIGSAGMLSDALIVPLMGRMYDRLGPLATLRCTAVLPVVVTIVFCGVWLRERAHGGYRIVRLQDEKVA